MDLRTMYCAFDWGVFWSGVQGVAVVVAATLALFQLDAFRRTEREKNTIQVFDMMDSGATGKCVHRWILRREKDANIENARRLITQLSRSERVEALDELVAAANLLDRVSLQYLTGILDSELYLRRMDETTLMLYSVLHGVRDLVRFDLSETSRLAYDCRENYRAWQGESKLQWIAEIEIAKPRVRKKDLRGRLRPLAVQFDRWTRRAW